MLCWEHLEEPSKVGAATRIKLQVIITEQNDVATQLQLSSEERVSVQTRLHRCIKL